MQKLSGDCMASTRPSMRRFNVKVDMLYELGMRNEQEIDSGD